MQATRDLPAFWRGSWADVRKDMKGRYPKHRWPEEPWAEAPQSPRRRMPFRTRAKALNLKGKRAPIGSSKIYQRPRERDAVPARRGVPRSRASSNLEQSEARRADPLMACTFGHTQVQVQLTFPSKDEAKAYAEKYGIPARVHATPAHSLKLQAYADNFR